MRHNRNPIAADILDDACLKWPELPSRTLARMVFRDNPLVFPSVEAARQSILYRRGRKPAQRATKGGPRYGMAESTAPRVAWNPDGYLPKSDEKPFPPMIVTVERSTRILVLTDIHVPYHNGPALRAAIEHGRKRGCDMIILNGDTLDFHKLSRFEKDPAARSAKGEIAAANQLLDALDDYFPKARKIFKKGNHEDRLEHYLMQHAPELFEVLAEKASLNNLLELEARGWELVDDKRPIYLGDLTLLHGHEYPTPVLGPVNAARGLFLRTKACAAVGHHHVTSEHTEPNVRRKVITTWSIGCLCELHPPYARFNKWNHGFAEIILEPSGAFQIYNHKIDSGTLIN